MRATKAEISAAFTEWQKRYRSDPKRFMAEIEIAKLATMEYGDRAAEYFTKIINEVKRK